MSIASISAADKSALATLARGLVEWFPSGGREFSWRATDWDPYRLIVTELLLQRTRAETVQRFVDNFFDTYPGWTELEKAPRNQLEVDLAPIGLQQRRAASLQRLAGSMLELGGIVPHDREAIDRLPGIGQYIANSIELLVHGVPRPLLDTNMSRVIERYVHPRKMADIRYDPWLQSAAQFLVEEDNSKMINWAVLDFAAVVCKPRIPDCRICPVRKNCHWPTQDKTV